MISDWDNDETALSSLRIFFVRAGPRLEQGVQRSCPRFGHLYMYSIVITVCDCASTCGAKSIAVRFMNLLLCSLCSVLAALCLASPAMASAPFDCGHSGSVARDSVSQVMSPSSSQHGNGEKDKQNVVVVDHSATVTDYAQGLPVVFGEAPSLSSTTSVPRATVAQSTPSILAAPVQAAAAS